MDSFKPLKRVKNPDSPSPEPGAIYLEDEDGNGSWVTSVVTDDADGITEADFDFDKGKAWAKAQES